MFRNLLDLMKLSICKELGLLLKLAFYNFLAQVMWHCLMPQKRVANFMIMKKNFMAKKDLLPIQTLELAVVMKKQLFIPDLHIMTKTALLKTQAL